MQRLHHPVLTSPACAGQVLSDRREAGRFRCALGSAGLSLAAAVGLAAVHGAAVQSGVPPRISVSTTSDLDPVNGLPAISDAGLPVVGGSTAPNAHFVDVHWQAALGFVPTDVDAAARVPGSAPGSAGSLAFSLLSNEGGVLDGDVVVLDGAGGLVPLVPEAALLAGLGRSDADIDVNGIAFDDAGLLLFTLQSDLDGTVLGTVEDGDVLRLEANGAVTRLFTEAEVQARFTTATGSTGAIGEVNGLEWVLGEAWVTTQGPSSWDGGVVAIGAFPIVVLDEATAGLGGAELDALAHVRPGDETPSFSMDVTAATAGDTFRAVLVGPPSSEHLVFFAGSSAVVPTPSAGGWGSLYLDPTDAWFQLQLGLLGASYVRLDAGGRYSVDYTLPSGALWGTGFAAEEGWSFQMLDLGTLTLSPPGRIVRR